jgi:hypothetical protein
LQGVPAVAAKDGFESVPVGSVARFDPTIVLVETFVRGETAAAIG